MIEEQSASRSQPVFANGETNAEGSAADRVFAAIRDHVFERDEDEVREKIAAALTPKPAPVEHRFPRKRDRMRFMDRNGYDGERAMAAKVFGPTDVLTVTRCDIGSWSHTVWFGEDPTGRGWNGVMFEIDGEPERYPLPKAPSQAGTARQNETNPGRHTVPSIQTEEVKL